MQLSNLVFLTKTDTAIGFVSQDAKRLNLIKERSIDKPLIITVPTLRNISSRIQSTHKNRVRRSTKTTFILPNKKSFRVSSDKRHNKLLEKLGWAYSTSANLSGAEYNEEFALNSADVVICPLSNNSSPSIILKLGKSKIKKVR